MTKTEIDSLVQELSRKGEARLIETHISWVILTDAFAYKIKKPMRYSFLNYSKLIRRKFYCEHEVELNSRYSDIYLDVVPIYRTDDTAQLEKGGEIIDYAVKMKRINGDLQMDRMLDKEKVTAQHMRTLAIKIANFHQRAEVVHPGFSPREMSQRFDDIRTVKSYLYDELGLTVDEQINEAILDANHFVNTHTHLFENRENYGFVRDLHGDLHAKNIFLTKDPILFDCIEFNDQYRQVDILSEIAFLCMDLEAKGRDDLADEFLDTYLKVFPVMSSPEEERLFAFYKSYRANVRAKVNALRARQAETIEEKERLLNAVSHYLDLMVDYTYHFNGTYQESEFERIRDQSQLQA